jgi:hypothetical protein
VVGVAGELPLGLFGLMLFGAQLGQSDLDSFEEVRLRVLDGFEACDEPALPGGQVDYLIAELSRGAVAGASRIGGGALGGIGEQRRALVAEQMRGEELAPAVDQGVLLDGHAESVIIGSGVAARFAGQVGVTVSGLADHATTADGAEHIPAQQVGAATLFGMSISACAVRV